MWPTEKLTQLCNIKSKLSQLLPRVITHTQRGLCCMKNSNIVLSRQQSHCHLNFRFNYYDTGGVVSTQHHFNFDVIRHKELFDRLKLEWCLINDKLISRIAINDKISLFHSHKIKYCPVLDLVNFFLFFFCMNDSDTLIEQVCTTISSYIWCLFDETWFMCIISQFVKWLLIRLTKNFKF